MEKESKKDMARFYMLEPDYDRPIYQVPKEFEKRIKDRLAFLYGKERGDECYKEVERLMKVHYAHKTPEMIEWEKDFDPRDRFTHKDAILITYGDLIRSKDHLPLETLSLFAERYLKGSINTLHILPFFPYSSDRGFAIIDFEEVDPRLGTWENIADLKANFKLMFDGVFNHVSSKSRWFQEFLNGNPEYIDFFIVFSTKNAISPDHLKLIVRPRTTPLLTTFSTLYGKKSVWTTFSADQIDLNFKNPKVLLKMVDILLSYIRRGADIVRLDAVTYLWAELGTSCAHLEQTHAIIKLFRDILDAVAPSVALITETNVPHKENVQYFGDGTDEAQMVYNFALPPLVLYTFQIGNSTKLTKWASSLEKVSDTATYFNILDCHDGISVMGARGILTEEEIEMMALRVLEHGGFISYKDNGDGTTSPYELNITWYSALNRDDADESVDFQIKRFLASRSIALALMGVPGIYMHGLFGSKNDADAVLEEGETRSINRRTIDWEAVTEALENEETTTHKVAHRFSDMIKKRTKERAFHPNSNQKILSLSDATFSVLRTPMDGKDAILCITNITSQRQHIEISPEDLGLKVESWYEILSEKSVNAPSGKLSLNLEPYDVLWLKC